MNMINADSQRIQLGEQRRKVDFDTYDVTVDELIRRVQSKRINVAPVYQRQFRWDPTRQSRLIESVLLGIPVPPLFMATNSARNEPGSWEVVDGLQRLLTLVNFLGDTDTHIQVGLTKQPLQLCEMDKLTSFNGCSCAELPTDIRTMLEDRPFKVIVLNDKSDLQVRFDLFERLNTGGISLSAQEIRECVFRGSFIDLLGELSSTKSFSTLVVLPKSKEKDGTKEEYVLRFFAYLETYRDFVHSVEGFLNNFVKTAHYDPQIETRRVIFTRTFSFLEKCFPNGLKTRKGQTPVNLFEAVSVGAALALAENQELQVPESQDWYRSPELQRLTTGATNSRNRVTGRIEYCRDLFLGRHA